METTTNAATGPLTGLRNLWNDVMERIPGLLTHDVLALVMRAGLAAVFFLSGRTKVEGVLTIKESTYALFMEEYQVPVLPPEIAAHMATYAEHALPILLVLGLFTRGAALGRGRSGPQDDRGRRPGWTADPRDHRREDVLAGLQQRRHGTLAAADAGG